jgi:hypothetical protein
MLRSLIFAGLLAAAGPAWAQVEVAPLAAPDAFSTPGRMTGLPEDLWRGTPVDTARAVLPLLAEKPLSPAAAALARRVLATGARGPAGADRDESLAGARANALIALSDVRAAAKILERTPALDRDPGLSQAAAEAALLTGDTGRACSVADALTAGRGEPYWLRLRAYCQLLAGEASQAQLTFDLAQSQARDATYGRLMGARLAGIAATGPASLRNGLDLALSRDLGLDFAGAKPSPAVAAALSGMEPAEPDYDVSGIDSDIGGLASLLRLGMPPPSGVTALIAAAADDQTKAKGRLQAAALLVAALSSDLPTQDRARLSAFAAPPGKAPAGRTLALWDAAADKRMGEAALLALWTCAEAGEAGPSLGDRILIVHALARAGLMADARTFALEGLAGLK